MTANYGTELARAGRMGFATGPQLDSRGATVAANAGATRAAIEGEVKKRLLPEFLNRIDATVIFEALAREDLVQVARMMLERTARTARSRSITLTWDDDVPEWLGAQAFTDTTYSGARPIRQLIGKHIEDSVVDTTFRGGAGRSQVGRIVHVSVVDNVLSLVDSSASPLALIAAEA
jgi:ATP-dependent Clp protease ATP-binding subunit ClpA